MRKPEIMSRNDRLAAYADVSARLAPLSDRRLSGLVDSAEPLGASIGGETLASEVGGVPVFVKKIALTDRERLPENLRSTANLFDLPRFYQYGVGSAGFGAWRELALHEMTTAWTLSGACTAFPLTYHWRVLPADPPSHHDDVDSTVAYWEGSEAVRERVTAIQAATASIVVFMEHLPQTLNQLLDSVEVDYPTVAKSLFELISFLDAQGVIHFDSHFDNILTDGEGLYLTDFGLASSTRFDLSKAEREFFAAHKSYDRCVATANLVNSIIRVEYGISDREDRNAVIRECAAGDVPAGLPDDAVAIVKEHAPTTAAANDFFLKLRTESRNIPYPASEIAERMRGRAASP